MTKACILFSANDGTAVLKILSMDPLKSTKPQTGLDKLRLVSVQSLSYKYS